MKSFLCFIACVLAGVSGHHLEPNKMDEIKMIHPNIRNNMENFIHLAKNFDSLSARKQVEDLNDFVDVIISEVSAMIVSYHFDPLSLPDIDQELDLLNSHLHLNLTEGLLSNISSIYRNGDVTLSYENRQVIVKVPIFFKIFKMLYNYDLKVDDNAILQGKMNGEVVLIEVEFAVKMDFKELEISLQSFQIPTLGAIKIKFDGGISSNILEALTKYITEQFEKSIREIAELVCKTVLEAIFDIINGILGEIKP